MGFNGKITAATRNKTLSLISLVYVPSCTLISVFIVTTTKTVVSRYVNRYLVMYRHNIRKLNSSI